MKDTDEPFDAIKELCDLLGECKMTTVFWVCPEPSHRGVRWNESKTVATCEVCGKTNNDG
jgi:hypothetical protein